MPSSASGDAFVTVNGEQIGTAGFGEATDDVKVHAEPTDLALSAPGGIARAQ